MIDLGTFDPSYLASFKHLHDEHLAPTMNPFRGRDYDHTTISKESFFRKLDSESVLARFQWILEVALLHICS